MTENGTQILYETPTKNTYDISRLVKSCVWQTKRSGSPGRVSIELFDGADIGYNPGGIINIRKDRKPIFLGHIFRVNGNEKNEIKIVVYDRLRYLSAKETYDFVGKTASEIVRQIAQDFRLEVGNISDTVYVIPSLKMDNKTLFDTILTAFDRTYAATGDRYYILDECGKLCLAFGGVHKVNLLFGDGESTLGFDHSRQIDTDTFNKIKLYRDNKITGKRDVWVAESMNTIGLWGVLQKTERADADLNEAQIKQQAENLLNLYNRPQDSLMLTAISDYSLRAGMSVMVQVQRLGVGNYYMIEELEHDLVNDRMRMKVLKVN